MKKVDTSCCSRFHIFDQANQLERKGLLNNLIHMNIPVKNTELKLQINVKINDIFKMDIKEISVDQDSFETEVKRFLIKELQKELDG